MMMRIPDKLFGPNIASVWYDLAPDHVLPSVFTIIKMLKDNH